MLKYYLLLSWRNIVRNKFYAFILTFGLAVGIASSLLLGTYTWHELTYDDFHEKKDRIFLVAVDVKEGTEAYKTGSTTPPTGPALQQEFPEIESFARLAFWFDDVVVSKDDLTFAEPGIVGADSSVFNIFTIPFISGNPKTALTEPNTVVITETIAAKYFKGENPMGKTLQFDHFFGDCKVTGVVKDYPDNSHFDFGILLSLSTFQTIHFDFTNSWGNHTFSTYILLNKHANAADLEDRLPKFVKTQLDPYLIRRYQKSYDEMYKGNDHYSLFLEPLHKLHLGNLLDDDQEGRKTLVYALALIGFIILTLVCINYTNLATVLSYSRAREVGIRKVSGSRGNTLLMQFLTESIVIAFIGLFFGLVIIESFLPLFNSLTGQSLHIDYTNPVAACGLVIFTLFMGLLAGIYPALNFASFNAVRALKGDSGDIRKRQWIRNSLVVFQFTVCIVMTVCTIVVYNQLSYMTNKNVGFGKDQVLVIKRADGLKENKTAFKNELKKLSGIAGVSFTETTPGRHFNGHSQHFKGRATTDERVVYPFFADEDLLQTLDIELLAGQSFKEQGTAQPKALLNEAAVRELGLDNPLAEKIDNGTMGNKEVDIIGVVKDFHFKSFHYQVEPLVIYPLNVDNDPHHNATFILVKISSQDVPATLQYIERQWKTFAGNYPFEYSFMDDDFNKLFERESTLAKVYSIFSIISILIACLGLLGLTAYFVNKRTKEIGIRKIVGASVTNIAILLSRQFVSWILISIAVGSALSWYLMHQWLQRFAYKTPITLWMFAASGALVLVVAFIAVGRHLYQAATRNPVETLRYE